MIEKWKCSELDSSHVSEEFDDERGNWGACFGLRAGAWQTKTKTKTWRSRSEGVEAGERRAKMEKAGPLRGLWRRGVAMSEVMKGSSRILPVLASPVQTVPQQQAPQLSSASTSCSTILSSQFQPCRRVRQYSSDTIRHHRQRVLVLNGKLEKGSFCVKHVPSSFHGDARTPKQQSPLPKRKFKGALNLYPTRQPKGTVDVQSFNSPFDESHRLKEARGHGNNVAELEARSAQNRVRPAMLREASKMVEQNLNPSHKVDGGIKSRQQNHDSLKVELKRVGDSRDSSRDTAPGNCSTHLHSAGTMSQETSNLQNLLQRGITIDSYMYVDVLRRCSKHKDLLTTKQVHDCIIQSEMDKDPYVARSLVNVYIQCGELLHARRVFDEIEKKTVITWTKMIEGYAKHDQAESAFELFNQMRQEGCRPDEVTYFSILKACASPLALTWGKIVHECIRHAGFESHVRVGTALIKMYAKCGCITEARRLFEKLTKRDVITWTAMIGGLAQNGFGHEAYRLFLQMRREGFEPNAVTYASILHASASAGALEWVKEVHGHARKAGLELDLRVGNALVHMYVESGSINDARLVFDRMEKRDVLTWTTMISGFTKYDDAESAFEIFNQMRQEGCRPDEITYLSILKACASPIALKWGNQVHECIRHDGFESDVRVGTALLKMYLACGCITEARRVFENLTNRNVITWTAMIGGLAHHGCGPEALELFTKMIADCVKPDRTTFVAVLSACCHGGLVDDGRRLFSAMMQDYGIEPDIVHYTCMVDLFGRAGHLEEAKLFISDMPIEPNVVTWKALLGACRTYGNVELGECAANEVFKLDPNDASGYVLLSNIYAAAGKWEKVSLVRTSMQKRGVRKEQGRSWIEVNNEVHEFVVGDTSHPEAKAIYTELYKLTKILKVEGYIPDTRLVLHDINEEDKELALCSHSEKLAIVYGLIHIPREEPIHVRKNLRVCPDCHTATKFISKVTGREIIARDANRFHHFKNGVCSCGDYW